MPKYWVKNYFTHGRFPEVGQKQKTEKKEREKERKLVITMAKLRMAHAWRTHGARMAHASRLGQNIGGNKFWHTGDSPKWVKSRRRRKKRERESESWWKQWPSYAWRTHGARMAHASRLGQFMIFAKFHWSRQFAYATPG